MTEPDPILDYASAATGKSDRVRRSPILFYVSVPFSLAALSIVAVDLVDEIRGSYLLGRSFYEATGIVPPLLALVGWILGAAAVSFGATYRLLGVIALLLASVSFIICCCIFHMIWAG